MLQTAPLRDESPASATKLMGITSRTLVLKIGTTNIESSPERYDSTNNSTGQILKLLREVENVRIRDTLKNNWMRKEKGIGQHKSPRSNIAKTEDGNHLRRNRSHLLLKMEPPLNGNLDNKINDCNHN